MPIHSPDLAAFPSKSSKVTPYLKALVGALIAGLGSLYQALDNGGVSAQEWVATAIATLAALGIVWGIPNADPAGTHQDESVQPPEGGFTAIGLLLAVVVVVVILAVVTRL